MRLNQYWGRAVSLLLTGVLGISLLSGCASRVEAEDEIPEADLTITVETARPERRNVTVESNFSAVVQADSTVAVIPKASGEVVEKNYEVGDHVNAGDLLFRIDDEAAQIALRQARAVVTSAQAGYTAQQANTASMKASATETLGKMPTTAQQLENAVDAAYAAKVAAGNTMHTAQTSISYYEDQIEDLNDQLKKAKKQKK